MNYIEQLLQGQPVQWKSLGELGEFYGGLTGKNKNDFAQGNAKYISYMNVFSNTAIPDQINDFVKIEANEKQHKINYGDVLFTGSSESLEECGMTSVVNKEINEDIYLNSFCFGFRLNEPSEFVPDFLKHLFQSNKIRKQIIRTANGVTRFNISKKKMEKVVIPLPPLAVQQEIAKILDTFTTLEAELEAELDCRKRQYQYYRNTLLTFGDDVEWKALGEVLKRSKGTKVTASEMKEKDSLLGDVKIFAGGKTFAMFQRKDLPSKDIIEKTSIIVKSRGIIEFEYYDKPFSHKNEFWSYYSDTDKICLKFVYYYLKNNENHFQRIGEKMQMPQIAIPDTDKFKIPLPPIEEQKRIVEILDKFDTLTNSITEGLPKEIELRRKQYEYYREKLLMFNYQ